MKRLFTALGVRPSQYVLTYNICILLPELVTCQLSVMTTLVLDLSLFPPRSLFPRRTAKRTARRTAANIHKRRFRLPSLASLPPSLVGTSGARAAPAALSAAAATVTLVSGDNGREKGREDHRGERGGRLVGRSLRRHGEIEEWVHRKDGGRNDGSIPPKPL